MPRSIAWKLACVRRRFHSGRPPTISRNDGRKIEPRASAAGEATTDRHAHRRRRVLRRPWGALDASERHPVVNEAGRDNDEHLAKARGPGQRGDSGEYSEGDT